MIISKLSLFKQSPVMSSGHFILVENTVVYVISCSTLEMNPRVSAHHMLFSIYSFKNH